jgi:3-hydroxyisobutyrate dehydrogenase
MSQRIAFVGVGRMGANMARRLKDCGHDVTAVYDTHREGAKQLAAELGCKACDKLAEVTAAADVIFTVVTDDASMRAIFLGGGDNLLAGAKGRVFINCATVTPGIHREVYAAAKKAGASSLEACMASSISQAREGKLYLMLAGDEVVY